MSDDVCGYDAGNGPCQNPAGEDGRCWIDSHTPPEFSAVDLKQMDRAEARERLPPDEFERWERVTDLSDAADERAVAFDDADETATRVTVTADMETLGTDVDLYGNTLTVYLDPTDERLTDAVERLDEEFGGIDKSDLNSLTDTDAEAVGEALEDMLRSAIVAWDGEAFDDLPAGEPLAIVQQAREKWGLMATFEGLMTIIDACNEAQEERFEAIDSFRGAERRRTHRSA